MPADKELDSHYSAVRAVYDDAPFYAEGPCTNWQLGECLKQIDLHRGQSLVDVGGGSGKFASSLAACVGGAGVTVVEPSAAMLAGASDLPHVEHAVCSDATSWAEERGAPRYARALLKEMVHHLGGSEERVRLVSSPGACCRG